MNIKELSDQEKSVMLAQAMGWKITAIRDDIGINHEIRNAQGIVEGGLAA